MNVMHEKGYVFRGRLLKYPDFFRPGLTLYSASNEITPNLQPLGLHLSLISTSSPPPPPPLAGLKGGGGRVGPLTR